jgi:hypothetical protein
VRFLLRLLEQHKILISFLFLNTVVTEIKVRLFYLFSMFERKPW